MVKARSSLVHGLALALLAACGEPAGAFHCGDSAACRDGAATGVCETTGYCSFPDPGCASGARYGVAAGDGLADLCVGSTPPPPGAIPDPARSTIVLGAASVDACNRVSATLTVRDMDGNPYPAGGNTVAFAYAGNGAGFTPVVDRGDGTYGTLFSAAMAHAPAMITATLDGAAVADQQTLVVVSETPATSGLLFSVDAARATAACAAPAGDKWIDTIGGLPGALTSFVDPSCPDGMSGWCGIGTFDDPFRLAFDGNDDGVDFGASVPTARYTLAAWMRRRGTGTIASTGTGGTSVAPVIAKGAAETEDVTKDINYAMGLSPTHTIGSDFERNPDSQNEPLVGATVLADLTWHHVAVTYDGLAERIYVDGVLDSMLAITATPSISNLSRLCLGTTCLTTQAQAGHFRGDLALAAIYNRALPIAEIGALCHAQVARFAGGACP